MGWSSGPGTVKWEKEPIFTTPALLCRLIVDVREEKKSGTHYNGKLTYRPQEESGVAGQGKIRGNLAQVLHLQARKGNLRTWRRGNKEKVGLDRHPYWSWYSWESHAFFGMSQKTVLAPSMSIALVFFPCFFYFGTTPIMKPSSLLIHVGHHSWHERPGWCKSVHT